MKKAIFFDLYGTLIDILTDEYDPEVYSILSRYLSYLLIKIAPEELKRAYFEGIQTHLKQSNELYPEVDVHKIFFNIMHRYGNRTYPKSTITDTAMLFRSLTMRRFGAFSGLYDVLGSLAEKYNIALISDAQWVFAEPEIAMLGLDRFFRFRLLSSRMGFKKPDVRLFEMGMKKFMVNPEESVYIGDNPQKDLVGAKKAGMKFIIFRSECKVYNGFQPDQCFYDYAELENVLDSLWLSKS